MASNGIRDRVAIVGMGCTNFGERWDKSMGDLLVDAATEAVASAHIDIKDVDAFWFGTLFSGNSGLTLSRPAVSRSFAKLAPAIGLTSLAFGIWYALGAQHLAPYPL